MAYDQRLHVWCDRYRFRDGSVAPCFSWPSNETTRLADRFTDTFGDLPIASNKLARWKLFIERGNNATTTRIAEERQLAYKHGSITVKRWCPNTKVWAYTMMEGDLLQNHSTAWDLPVAASTVLDNTSNNEALRRLVADARNKQGAFRGSNFLAEIRDVIRGIRNPAKGIRDLVDRYHTTAQRRARRILRGRTVPRTRLELEVLENANPGLGRTLGRSLSDSWLEFQFGVKPLISDVQNAIYAGVRLADRQPRARIKGYAERFTDQDFAFASRDADTIGMGYEVRTSHQSRVAYYGAVRLKVDCPEDSFSQEFGTNMSNFLPAVWEAIPFSFLVDYFSNVGDVVEALSFPRSDIAWVGRTWLRIREKKSLFIALDNTSPAYPSVNHQEVVEHTPMSLTWTRKRLERAIYTGSVVPTLQWEIPGEKNWRKWLNIGALASKRVL